jgi:hypothetical protein
MCRKFSGVSFRESKAEVTSEEERPGMCSCELSAGAEEMELMGKVGVMVGKIRVRVFRLMWEIRRGQSVGDWDWDREASRRAA